MPVGEPTAQSKATMKYRKKVGIVNKSFTLKKDLVDQFKEACTKAGTNQAAQISKMMKEFIEEVENEK